MTHNKQRVATTPFHGFAMRLIIVAVCVFLCMHASGCAVIKQLKMPTVVRIKGVTGEFEIGAIVRTETGQVVSFDELMADLEDVRVVYVGERHSNEAHHDVQLRILKALYEKDPTLFVGMEMFGMAPHYRKAVESGKVAISEESEASIALGLKSSYLRVPFMPLRGIIGTDFPNVRDDIKEFEDPLGSGIKLMALPKIDLDVAILHVPYADEFGNANISGAVWMDDDMAKTAKKTIITCERIVESEDIRHFSSKAQLPMQTTSAVVKIPFGAHPTSCYDRYTFDAIHIQEYLKMDFPNYKAKFIDVNSHNQYLDNVGGSKTILDILL